LLDQPDVNIQKAFNRLRHNEDFILVVTYLASNLARLDVKNRRLDGLNLHWSQGAAQALGDLLSFIESR